jgi:hypothetical protein
LGKGGGGPVGGLEGKEGGGPLGGAPGAGGGALFLGRAGNSLLGVDGPVPDPEELALLSCFFKPV